jgi:8-oxo-dGTP pyrophosphatase MutT (NUDIX family)
MMTKSPLKIQAACALIIAPTGEERVLCVSRKDDPHAWGLPGGKIERGEAPKTAAKRELEEETGLVMHPSRSPRIFLGQCAVPNSGRFMLTATYLVPSWRGEISTEESGRVGWRSWSDLMKGPFWEYNQALHEAYKSLMLSRTFR